MANDGKLNGIDMSLYCDCGSSPNDLDVSAAQAWADNGEWFNFESFWIMILNIVAEYFSYIAKKAHPRCKNFVILTSDIKKKTKKQTDKRNKVQQQKQQRETK